MANTTPEVEFTIEDFAPEGFYRPATRANTLRSLKDLGKKPKFRKVERTTVLAIYEGSRGERHEVRIGRDGNVYCTCPAWRLQALHPYNRTCKHINDLFGIPQDLGRRRAPKRAL